MVFAQRGNMAANCARRSLLSSSASAKAFLSGYSKSSATSSSFTSGTTKFCRFAFPSKPTSAARFSRHKLSIFSRFPLELSSAQSLMPLHSVATSAFLTSMLYLQTGECNRLAEGL